MNRKPKYLFELPQLGIKKIKVRIVLGDNCHLGLMLIGAFFGLAFMSGSLGDMRDVYRDFRVFQNPEYIEADVRGQCRRAESRKRNPYPPVKCDFQIVYEGRTYGKQFSYFGSVTDYSNVRAVRYKDDHSLISVDLAWQKITATFLEKLWWLFVGLIISIGMIYMIINRFKILYFKCEINWGDARLVLIPIDYLREFGARKVLKYFNRIGKRRVKIRYGELLRSKAGMPYFISRNNRSCVLIVHNKKTGNFLVVDQYLKRLKISKTERDQLRGSLDSLETLSQ